MCDGTPSSVSAALAHLREALDFLNSADAASQPDQVQANVLRELEHAEARHTAARARFLAAFAAQTGCEADGQCSPRAWLKWQTQVTSGAAAGAVGWAKRLSAHPVIDQALAAGDLSCSWAKHLCSWTDRLPEGARDDADRILCGAAAEGMVLRDLAGLAQEMYQRTRGRREIGDDDDGFDDRFLRLGITFGGAGHTEGALTPACATALSAVLDALGKKAGPEDTRTAGQRRHDALEEACRRMITAGMVPDRAGQPTKLNVHMTLGQLRDLPGADDAERAWIAAQATTRSGWLTGPEASAAACDATLTPVVTGHVDPAALDRLTDVFQPGLAPATRDRLRRALLALAAQTLSGPGGLAAYLRTSLTGAPASRGRAGAAAGPPATISLPLDIGAATVTIPAHIRKAAGIRHPRCAFPGCYQPLSACDMHHLIPRSRGGPTSLRNLVPLCHFHHLIVIHRWGWTLRLEPDGTTTAMSPDHSRTLHSHGPPHQAA